MHDIKISKNSGHWRCRLKEMQRSSQKHITWHNTPLTFFIAFLWIDTPDLHHLCTISKFPQIVEIGNVDSKKCNKFQITLIYHVIWEMPPVFITFLWIDIPNWHYLCAISKFLWTFGIGRVDWKKCNEFWDIFDISRDFGGKPEFSFHFLDFHSYADLNECEAINNEC